MSEEYYIRSPDSEKARGPYDLDKLTTLAEAGQINSETLYFDETMESWVLIAANDALKNKIFPQKKRLSLRQKSAKDLNLLNPDDENDVEESGEKKGISVEQMLAAAEADTDETRHLRSKRKWEQRAAAIAVPTLATVLLISALTYIYPSWGTISAIIDGEEGSVKLLFSRPLVFLGAFDMIMAFFLFLSATEVYPLVRFRAMLGGGYFAILYWASWIYGQTDGLYLCLSVLAYGLGIYIMTLTLNFRLMTISAAVALAGVLGFAYFTTLQPLLATILEG